MDPRHKIFVQNSRDLHAFFKRVGRIWIYEELKFLGLEPQMISGEFWFESVTQCVVFSPLSNSRAMPRPHTVLLNLRDSSVQLYENDQGCGD